LLVYSVFDVAIDRSGVGALIPTSYVRSTSTASMAADRAAWVKFSRPLAKLLAPISPASDDSSDLRNEGVDASSSSSATAVAADARDLGRASSTVSRVKRKKGRSREAASGAGGDASDAEASVILRPAPVAARSRRGTATGPIRMRVHAAWLPAAASTAVGSSGAPGSSAASTLGGAPARAGRTLRGVRGSVGRAFRHGVAMLTGRSEVVTPPPTAAVAGAHSAGLATYALHPPPLGAATSLSHSTGKHEPAPAVHSGGDHLGAQTAAASPSSRLGVGPTFIASPPHSGRLRHVAATPARLPAPHASPAHPPAAEAAPTVFTESMSVAALLRHMWGGRAHPPPVSAAAASSHGAAGSDATQPLAPSDAAPKPGRVCTF
jgi:hypothetical protein